MAIIRSPEPAATDPASPPGPAKPDAPSFAADGRTIWGPAAERVLPGDDYATAFRDFRWRVPGRFNIAEAVCDLWAAAEPDRVCLIEGDPDGPLHELTYGAFRRAADRLANAFAARGIGPGDRVAIALPQRIEAAVVHAAIYKLGAIAVPLAHMFGIEALAYRLKDAGARAFVTTLAGAARIEPVRGDLADLETVITIDGTAPGTTSYDTLVAAASDRFETRATDADAPAMMIYTSGTTGPPKGALHAHRVLIGHLPGVAMHHDHLPQPGDRLWTPADWAWAGGLLNVLLPGLALGVPVVAHTFPRGFDPEAAWRLMAHLKVRNAFIPPTALRMLRGAPTPPPDGLALRTIGSGGETLGGDTFAWAQRLGLVVNEFYGQTECNLVLSSSASLGVSRPGLIGRPVPGHRVAIVDADGRPVAPGTTGTIAIQRPDPVMFLSYWGKPAATRDKFAGDFMLTGDQGVMDEAGYVAFVGRDDDVITSSGYRIGPGEIEDCLAGHPSVEIAVVVGKPDPLRTEIVAAFVKPVAGVTGDDALAEDIRRHVKERLSPHEYPREIAFVDEIPLTTTGKVIRRFFRERVRAEAEAPAASIGEAPDAAG